MDDHIHHFDDFDYEIYLTEEEHNFFSQEYESNTFELEIDQYQIGYKNVVNVFQIKLNLGSRDVVINKGMPNPNNPSRSPQNAEKQKEKQEKRKHCIEGSR